MVGGTCFLVSVFQLLQISVYLWENQFKANGYVHSKASFKLKIIFWSRNQFEQFNLFCYGNLGISISDNSVLYRYAAKSDGGLMGTVDKLPHIEVSESNFITSTYRLVRCRMRF